MTTPNVARVYDCLLGGKDNFAADREAAARLLEAVPSAALVARENRAFLARAVRFLAREAGICQFLDIGTGLPTVGSVHEIGPGWPGSRRAVGFRLVGADEAGPAGPAVRTAALTISRALGARAVP